MNGHAAVVAHLLHAEQLIDAAPTALARGATNVSAFSTLSSRANVAEGPLVEIVGTRGQTPVHVACAGNHVAVVRVLLPLLRAHTTGETSTLPLDNNGVSPLHVAATEGHSETLQLLCTHLLAPERATIDAGGFLLADNTGETALLKACRNGHEDCVEMLLTWLSTLPRTGATSSDAYVNAVSEGPTGVTALHEAVQYNHVDIVRKLLAARANPALVSRTQWHALHIAAYHGSTDIVEVVLGTSNTDVDVAGGPDGVGATPLMRCCCLDQEDALRILLTHGASAVAVDAHGASALHYAAAVGVVPHRCVEVLGRCPDVLYCCHGNDTHWHVVHLTPLIARVSDIIQSVFNP